ncbi:MAG: T9SS type A sorting domain-containing protein [Ignavibacteria bacterium]|nr:T9SS type A sorting domain-containing protein [Ignavibacteria bacterium]
MKSLRIALFIFLFSNLCFSQTGWYQVNSGTNNTLFSICFINLNTGFAGGYNGTLLKTVTTGNSWQIINLNDTNLYIQKIYFKDQSTGFVLANKLESFNWFSQIYKTTNGGNNWFLDQTQIDNVLLLNIEFVNSNIGYMSGGLYANDPGKFFKSTNGGLSWEELETGLSRSLSSQKFINEFTGFAGTSYGIYKTTDGAYSWQRVHENYSRVYSIKFINAATGFACGGSYTGEPNNINKSRYILKTTDGGNNWNFIYRDTADAVMSDILINSEGIIYGCGGIQSGFIIKTTNGGANWITELTSASNWLSNITNSNLKGYSVGANGTIFKKDNIVSITQISTGVPSSIKLYQNYPNPFNPETTIKFDISKSGFISLKIYDISGKEVQNLFNGVKEAGSYQLKFDGANLNSGVYFYKLITNGTTITKSMVLVK